MTAEPPELEPRELEPPVEGLSLEELSLPSLPPEATAEGAAELLAVRDVVGVAGGDGGREGRHGRGSQDETGGTSGETRAHHDLQRLSVAVFPADTDETRAASILK